MNETMTGAEFRATREMLGLTNVWLSDHLNVAERSVVRWGDDAAPIPAGVATEIHELEDDARERVAELETFMTDVPLDQRELVTYRTDDALRLVNPSDAMPASWHRAIAARVRERVPGLRLVYAPEK